MPKTQPDEGRTLHPAGAAFSVAVAGLFITVMVFLMGRQMVQRSFGNIFEADAIIRAQLVMGGLDRSLQATRAVKQYLDTVETAEGESFRAFALSFADGSGQIRSIGWLPAVPGNLRREFEASAGKSRPGYGIFEYGPSGEAVPAREREMYYPVLFAEPGTALDNPGFDAGSAPERLAALERARDSGGAAVSESIKFGGESTSKGFCLVQPVYARGAPVKSLEDRKRALKGFVLAELDAEAISRASLERTIPLGLPFEIMDFSSPEAGRIIYSWTARLKGAASWRDFFYPAQPVYQERFRFAGSDWGILVTPNQGYMAIRYPLDYCLILPAGLLLTLLVAAHFYNSRLQKELSEAAKRALESEIDERRQTEEALRESEERLRLAISSARLGLFDLDLISGKARVSDEYFSMLGYKPGEQEPTIAWWRDSIHPDDRDAATGVLESLALGKSESYQIEIRLRTKEGGWKWIQSSGKVVGYGEDSAPRRMIGVHSDITERKLSELEKEKMFTELQKAFDSVRTLEGLLPICSACKKIRDDKGYWVQVESYIQKKTNAEFTHGICPDCARELYPDLDLV